MLLEEGGCFTLDDGAVSTVVEDEVILVAELAEGKVVSGNSKD